MSFWKFSAGASRRDGKRHSEQEGQSVQISASTDEKSLENKEIIDKQIKPGYADALTYEAVGIARVVRTARAWRGTAMVLALACTCEAAALVGLAPMKTAVPYVIEVDRTSGLARILDAADRTSIPAGELTDKYWLSQYVLARENYDWQTVDYEFRKVRELSTPAVFEPYATQFEGEKSLDVVLGQSKCMRPEILSVQMTGDGIASVRFVKRRINALNMSVEGESYWTATVGYAYEPAYTHEEKRLLVNPFGFKVTSYRVDQEFTRNGLLLDRSRPVEAPPADKSLPPAIAAQRSESAPRTDTSGLGIPTTAQPAAVRQEDPS